MFSVVIGRSFVVNKLVGRMCSTKLNYDEAVRKLNLLQSNKSTIEQIRNDIRTGQKCTNIQSMECYLSRTGVTLTELDELSVIHVAGTKGKGSTSAMCESILRHHGFRTGFYSSPHLVAVRERIRLDGLVLSEELFAKYFHQVYNLLDASKESEGDMPKYFAFLTVMAFYVFLKEKVDVAIIEVGIGGIVDYTNVIRKTPVVGITALGLDHTSILGTTLDKIAAAKAGIMKAGCEAYTVSQPPEAMEVLKRVADAVQCPLTIVPEYSTYKTKWHLHTNLEAYQMNASLAIQLANAWMRLRNVQFARKNGFKNGVKENHNFKNRTVLNGLPNETVEGLVKCKWPGRYHVIESNYAWFYMDGAHTKESMEICADWFENNSRCEDKILIFSATGDRNAEVLLKPLKKISFNTVYFVIPTAYKETKQNNDNYSLVEQAELIGRCQKHLDIWKKTDCYNSNCNVIVLECVADALVSVKNNHNMGVKASVLITGSLHLVGAALSIIDPNLSS